MPRMPAFLKLKPAFICLMSGFRPWASNSLRHQVRAKKPRRSSWRCSSMTHTPFILVSVKRIRAPSVRVPCRGWFHADQSKHGVILLIERAAKRRHAFSNLLLDGPRVCLHGLKSFDQVLRREIGDVENVFALPNLFEQRATFRV